MSRNYKQTSSSPAGRWRGMTLAVALFGLLVACQPELLNPPRQAADNAGTRAGATLTDEPLVIPAPTATASTVQMPTLALETGPNPRLVVWVNETSEEHEEALQQIATDFEGSHHIDLELRLVSPALLPDLIATSVLSATLPDIVLHPAAYTVGWAENDILDAELADRIIDEIGRETFDEAALELVALNGRTAAIPSDGYQQLILYRSDWQSQLGLEVPDDYDAMLALAEASFDPESPTSGFVVATESNLVETHQAFEHIAVANDCQLIDEKGEVLLLEPECQEALEFYFQIINQFSPVGVQTNTSAENAYLAGRTGMIMGTPELLVKLAGMNANARPTCNQCAGNANYLAENSGFLTRLLGRSARGAGANFGEVTYLGITRAADPETASAFARYWFDQGYNTWLAVESEKKVPMRWGTADEPREFIDAWGQQPLGRDGRSLEDIYGAALVSTLREGVAASDRWGLTEGHGTLIADLYQDYAFPVVLQEMLSGYFGTAQTLVELYRKTTDLIPNYEYPLEGEAITVPEG